MGCPVCGAVRRALDPLLLRRLHLGDDALRLVVAEQAPANGIPQKLLGVSDAVILEARRRPGEVHHGIRDRAAQDLRNPGERFHER